VTRYLRRLAALLAALALALGVTWWTAAPAFAAEDQVDSYAIAYEVRPSGVVRATETIVFRFGTNSGRHGIDRWFVTREPYDETQDAVYSITNIDVSSPTRGVSTNFTSSTTEGQGGRFEEMRVRIGDADETISADTATYVIGYDIGGAMRSFTGYDEFYWDAVGTGWEATLRNVTVTVSVPGGVSSTADTTCNYGPAGATNKCEVTVKNGSAAYSQARLAPNEGMTVSAKIQSGLVTDNTPHLEPDGSKLSPAEKAGLAVAGGIGLLLTVGSPVVGVLWWRRNGRDQRYAGLPPGMVPLAGQEVRIVPHDPDLPIPVAFSPPKVPVAEAGLLVDGQVDARETAATIIDLAVRGALIVEGTGEDEFRVTLVDPDKATAPHEMVLLTALFSGQPPGATRDLSSQGSLLEAHRQMQTSVRNQVASRGWFRKVPSATTTGSFGFGALALVVFAVFGLGAWVLWIVLPLAPILITVAVIRAKLKRGQRTADGRAVCDQVEGFQTYLATAEADQLRFEEGEDIFSKYLPWAIIFELTDRWAKICGDLVAMGRLPNQPPTWYHGNGYLTGFNTGFLTSSLTAAATPAPSSGGSSGSGFGGGSSFSGGGFSGGGGGGGGGGSW
jgi:uncharacterized membrane protein YgcG